ncbi:sigma-w pathway protein ysdB [Niallia sp. 01092]|uniref:sigma-w pathway protein ysdB n=1 Tax=unclassified Niallia TaxID=2837522 RepID=UPI003FCFB05E
MMWILRSLLLALILFILYRIVAFFLKPERKLAFYRRQNKYYLLDDPKNVRMNFLLTYKGFLFEGEKYVDNNPSSSNVVSILIWPTEPFDTKLMKEDKLFIENSIQSTYPHAKIQWNLPKI